MSGENVKNGFRQASDRNNAPYANDLNLVTQATFSASAGAANVCNVAISLKDANGALDLTGQPFKVWLSDSAAGLGLTATTASGTVRAKSASGYDLATLTTKKALLVQPLATGIYTLEITDTAKTLFYVVVQNEYTGQTFVSARLITANYG